MAQPLNQSISRSFYFGGLAEFVSHPTPLTFSFFEYWFRGDTSLGRALSILNLPYTSSPAHILAMHHDASVVDLKNEEATLYGNTVFQYKQHDNPEIPPSLVVNPIFMLHPFRVINTVRILLTQSSWIANPEKTLRFADSCLQSISHTKEYRSIREIDEDLTKNVWPNVLAIGMLCEFYDHLLKTETQEQYLSIQRVISDLIKDRDWFFLSLVDQQKVQSGELSMSGFLELYGLRADNDYELSEPRWYEIPANIQERIAKLKPTERKRAELPKLHDKQQKLIDTMVELLILRSNAKKQALFFIDQLRKKILQNIDEISDLSYLTRDALLGGKPIDKNEQYRPIPTVKIPRTHKQSGKGTGVSRGIVDGNVVTVHDTHTQIPPAAVGIFPNASPEFSTKYPECTGLIFLRGGLTSHGSIVAREFGIPAIIAPDAEGIPDNTTIRIDGERGDWTVL